MADIYSYFIVYIYIFYSTKPDSTIKKKCDRSAKVLCHLNASWVNRFG